MTWSQFLQNQLVNLISALPYIIAAAALAYHLGFQQGRADDKPKENKTHTLGQK